MKLKDRIQHAWTAFTDNRWMSTDHGQSSGRPLHKTVSTVNTASLVAPIYNRIAIDVSMAKLRHVKVDPKTEDVKIMDSGLNHCLNVEANIDQTGIQFMQDLVYSMFDEGVVAVVPVETTISPKVSEGYDIDSLRVGKIVQWFPEHVKINLYNQQTGQNEDIILPKKMVAIIENPLYAAMNADNSTLKRLMRKMATLDTDELTASSDRIDIMVQVPYAIQTELQRTKAEARIRAIETQLSKGKHGVVYMDATEKVTQLNRPINSQLSENVDKLRTEFCNQLGMTESIFNGTADEAQLRVYYSRTVDPIIENILAEFKRKFLTKTAMTQGQDIQYYRDMFKFVTVEMISSLSDTVRRNFILTSNEVRKILGHKPSNDPRADELFNPNIADKNQDQHAAPSPTKPTGSLTSPEEPEMSEIV